MAVNDERWGAVLRAVAAPERPEPALRCMRCRQLIGESRPAVRWDAVPELLERFLALHRSLLSSAAGLRGDDPQDYPFVLCAPCRTG